MAELGVAVRMMATFFRLAVDLARVAQRPKQLADRVGADLVAQVAPRRR
jgi:hypothetical protein